ncbi:L-2-hydroxyglutarate dehydrogenase [Streptomyces microflavus]
MMTHAAYDCDVLVIGGGIVGLSTAYALQRAAPGTRVTVLEKEHGPARHQTGRNSGVIHSGIYYRPGSLKARYALRGSAELADFCAEHGIAHATTGKLIVATERSELPRLHGLVQRGREHGLPVRELGPAQIAEYDPRSGVSRRSGSPPRASATSPPSPPASRRRSPRPAASCGTGRRSPR